MKTKVIFRTWNAEPHTVIALFPREPGDSNPETCMSYEHIGQHGAAHFVQVMGATHRASKREYTELLTELESIGYDLTVAQRATGADYGARLATVYREA